MKSFLTLVLSLVFTVCAFSQIQSPDDFFQEENDEKDTAKVCYVNYGVTFPMLATSAVRGSDANPIFKHLNAKTSSPNWNFYKYVVSADRQSVTRFNSRVKPDSAKLESAIKSAF